VEPIVKNQRLSPRPIWLCREGYACVKYKAKFYYIDKNNKILLEKGTIDKTINGIHFTQNSKNIKFIGSNTNKAHSQKSNIVKKLYKNAASYIGHMLNNKRHGKGIFYYPNGSIYEGQFVSNQLSGFGKLTLLSGNYYKGYFFENLMHGKGEYIYKNGTKTIGIYKEGFLIQGETTYSNSRKYVGAYFEGEKHGQGTYYSDGNTYTGRFSKNKMHGDGQFIWANGTSYSGQFEDDKIHGTGTMTYQEGDKFVGEFKFDKPNGKGQFIYKNGKIIIGCWRDGDLIKVEAQKNEVHLNTKSLNPSPIKTTNQLINTNIDPSTLSSMAYNGLDAAVYKLFSEEAKLDKKILEKVVTFNARYTKIRDMKKKDISKIVTEYDTIEQSLLKIPFKFILEPHASAIFRNSFLNNRNFLVEDAVKIVTGQTKNVPGGFRKKTFVENTSSCIFFHNVIIKDFKKRNIYRDTLSYYFSNKETVSTLRKKVRILHTSDSIVKSVLPTGEITKEMALSILNITADVLVIINNWGPNDLEQIIRVAELFPKRALLSKQNRIQVDSQDYPKVLLRKSINILRTLTENTRVKTRIKQLDLIGVRNINGLLALNIGHTNQDFNINDFYKQLKLVSD